MDGNNNRYKEAESERLELELELGRLTEWKRQKGSRATSNVRLRELKNGLSGKGYVSQAPKLTEINIKQSGEKFASVYALFNFGDGMDTRPDHYAAEVISGSGLESRPPSCAFPESEGRRRANGQ